MKVLKYLFHKQCCLNFGMSLMAFVILKAETERLQIPENIRPSMREVAIPEMGNSKLDRLLSRYYVMGLGGAEVWKNISSMRMKGNFSVADQTFNLLCYQRKPNRLKMILSNSGTKVVLGYDGKKAWQHVPNSDAPAIEMASNEARKFIHSSVFGNYLLYPYRSGKTIDYLGTVRERGTVCHHLRVTLKSGYRVDYYIDIRNYLDTKIVNFDDKSGHSSTLICEDFKAVLGFPVAHKVTSIESSGSKSILLLKQVDFNVGLTDWIFEQPK